MEQMMDIKVENGKLKMEISIEDLIFLLNTDPGNINNTDDGPFNMIKPGKEHEFAKKVAELLYEPRDTSYKDWIPRWAIPFNEIFEELAESGDEIIAYFDEGEITPELMEQWRKDVYP